MNLKELFLEKEGCFNFNTEKEMDNIESLCYFLESIIEDYKEENEVDFLETMCILKLEFFDYNLVLSSGGNGDFFSHCIEYWSTNKEV